MAYSIKRFLEAQKRDYSMALSEIRAGRKQSHWIWYIFPQLKALGYSDTAKYYGIENLSEAKAYLADVTLRKRLIEISEALLKLEGKDIKAIMGNPDDKKLLSSMTLFHLADPGIPVFRKVIDQYFNGKPDKKTLDMCIGK